MNGTDAALGDDPPAPADAHRSAAEQSLLEAEIHALFEQRITFNAFMGFRVESLADDKVRIGFDMRAELIGHYLHGRLHGGVISSVLDATGGLAVTWALANFHRAETTHDTLLRFSRLGTVDLRVDYLRQGIGRHFACSAEVMRLGRRIASTRMDLVNDTGTLIATGAATYVVS